MTIHRHLFDGVNRVSAKVLDTEPVLRWIPPTIGKSGNLVHAEPREESVLRQTVAQVVPRPSAAAPGKEADGSGRDVAGSSSLETAQNFEQAREEGMLLGRQEGLQQGLDEGRRLGQAQGLEQGLQQGREQGLKEGYAAGLKNAEADIRQQSQTLKGLMTHLRHALNEQDYQLEQALLNLSREIARHVVQRELMIDSSHIIAIVRQALATLPPSRDNVRILVHPDDLPVIEQAIEDSAENWRVLGSKNIQRGGCRVETDQSTVDFTIGERFKQVLEQIVDRQFSEGSFAQVAGQAAVLPAGESFEPAPEPVIRAAQRARSPAAARPSLRDEAAGLMSASEDDPAGARD